MFDSPLSRDLIGKKLVLSPAIWVWRSRRGEVPAFAFVMSLPEETDEVIVERAALFTWDDKSMNHLFQHLSAVAPGGHKSPP